MISIQMGGFDVVLGIQCLQSLGIVALNFHDLFMIFSSQGNKVEIRGIQRKPSKVIISNSMKTSLKNGNHVVSAQLCSLDVQTSISSYLLDLQIVMNNHSKLFEEIPKGLPPARDHDHVIYLQPSQDPQQKGPITKHIQQF
jgi:hypothetical protein